MGPDLGKRAERRSLLQLRAVPASITEYTHDPFFYRTRGYIIVGSFEGVHAVRVRARSMNYCPSRILNPTSAARRLPGRQRPCRGCSLAFWVCADSAVRKWLQHGPTIGPSPGFFDVFGSLRSCYQICQSATILSFERPLGCEGSQEKFDGDMLTAPMRCEYRTCVVFRVWSGSLIAVVCNVDFSANCGM